MSRHNRRSTYGGLDNDRLYFADEIQPQRRLFSDQQQLQTYPIPPVLSSREELLIQSAYERIALARSQGRTNVDLTPEEIAALELQRAGHLPILSPNNRRVDPASTASLASPPATPKATKSATAATASSKSKIKTGSRSSSAASLAGQQSTVKPKKKTTFFGGSSSPTKSKSRHTSRKNSLQLDAAPSLPSPETNRVPLSQYHGMGTNFPPGSNARYATNSRPRSNSRYAVNPGGGVSNTHRVASSPESSRPRGLNPRERPRSGNGQDPARESQDHVQRGPFYTSRYEYDTYTDDYDRDYAYPTLPSRYRVDDQDTDDYYATVRPGTSAAQPPDLRRVRRSGPAEVPLRDYARPNSRETAGSPVENIRYANVRRNVPSASPIGRSRSPLPRDGRDVPLHPGFDRVRSNESYGSTPEEEDEDSEGSSDDQGVRIEVGLDGSVARRDERGVSGEASAGKKGKGVVGAGSGAKKRKGGGARR
ncbi:unnamed protein product [Zymoseptoria tritici ST99CH_3D1]|uniref:Uncharacterized protein n=1 Tax=Zymoseptoria tritici ST99CH_1E4 TaxID=1276532 RepID=A0A2H1GP40_ZYMTR|nr:unnamed protein product [Zymoseptoria tritici ST99CH_1E4]SMR57749.1 unnamed protein product [Zymoseptoria tritici ST99CH_3D1]